MMKIIEFTGNIGKGVSSVEKFIVYIYRNPNKNFQMSDKTIINFDKEKGIFIGIIQNVNGLSKKIDIKNKYNLSSYEFNQDDLWKLIRRKEKYKLSILKVTFKVDLEPEDSENFREYLKGKISLGEIKPYIDEYSEIQEIDFKYKSAQYSIKSTGVVSVITKINKLEHDLLVSPILDLMGIKNLSKNGRIL